MIQSVVSKNNFIDEDKKDKNQMKINFDLQELFGMIKQNYSMD